MITIGKHLSKYSSEADYNNNKDNHIKPHISLITSSQKKMKYEKKILVNLITFYIDDIEYQAKKDMTWEEWINSEYNTIQVTNTIITGYVTNDTGSKSVICMNDNNYEDVMDVEKIIPNYNYICNNLISFNINGVNYFCEEGMTWEEWINSEYNTDKLTTIKGNLKLVHYNNILPSAFAIYGDDIILNNTYYLFGMSGGI